MKVYVVVVTDKDGYDIPVAAVEEPSDAAALTMKLRPCYSRVELYSLMLNEITLFLPSGKDD